MLTSIKTTDFGLNSDFFLISSGIFNDSQPFTAAHTYIAHIGQCPPRPLRESTQPEIIVGSITSRWTRETAEIEPKIIGTPCERQISRVVSRDF